jgi:hypothetical protein
MSNRRKSKYENKFPKGHQFGYWTVADGTIYGSPAHIDVNCVCGTRNRVDVYSLQKGRSTSCGCQTNKKMGTGSLDGTTLYRATVRAARSAPVSVSYDDMAQAFNNQNASCTLTGQSLNASNARLVRLDNSQPFTPQNVTWVHNSVSPTATQVGVIQTAKLFSNSANIFDKLGMKPDSGEK